MTDEAKPQTISDVPCYCRFDEAAAVEELVPHPRNPNKHPDKQIAMLAKIIRAQGWRNPVVVSNRSGFIVKGHGRLEAARLLGVASLPVERQDYESEAAEYADMIADNRIAELADPDAAMISELLQDIDASDVDNEVTGFDAQELEQLLLFDDPESKPGNTDENNEIPDTPAEAVTAPGDIWQLGRHRLICGDSTDPGTMAALMGDERAALIHADPPYGMGKQIDGVANDNLYGDDLDAFQMSWWRAVRPFVIDKGSAYIWGTAPNLWRLWYRGGLCDSEVLTLRNELVWDKQSTPGMRSDEMTQYPDATERCLFIQFGQQKDTNINTADFPDEWLPLYSYLAGEARAAGVGTSQVIEVCGCQMFGHWFTRSQFNLIPEKHYAKLREAYPGHFGRSWEVLDREWQVAKKIGTDLRRERHEKMRAYFDNAHDIMRDVWTFKRVGPKERHGHATPKPVDLTARCLKTSLPEGGLCVEPFCGSGSTIIAAEVSGRRCYAAELLPEYVDVTVARWEKITGQKAERVAHD